MSRLLALFLLPLAVVTDIAVAAGYVLSCQAFPISDKVVLDFDQL